MSTDVWGTARELVSGIKAQKDLSGIEYTPNPTGGIKLDDGIYSIGPNEKNWTFNKDKPEGDFNKKKVTGQATSSAQSVSSAAPTAPQSVGVVDTTTRRGTGQVGSVVGLLSTIQKSLLGL